MKIFEKVLIASIVLFFIGVLFFDLPVGFLYFVITLLSICYLLGGAYFFNISRGNRAKGILSGIVIGLALGTLPFALQITRSTFCKVLIFLNVIYSIILICIWVLKKDAFPKEYKSIFYRSFSVSLITSFFTFSSIYNSFYRDILKRITKDDASLTANLLMFDAIDTYKKSMKYGNYDVGIEAAKKAISYGKKWRDYDISSYQDFSGAYEFLAEAYIRKGSEFFDNTHYKQALQNYRLADSVFNVKEFMPKYPKVTKKDIYSNRWNLLTVYDKLGDYENYDKEFEFLTENYSKIKDTIDLEYYFIIKNAAENFYKRAFYKEVIELNTSSLLILKNDSVNNIEHYKDTYMSLIKTYLITSDIANTKHYLKKYAQIFSKNDCRYLFYRARLLQKTDIKEALKLAKKSCECFKKENNFNNQFFSNLILSQIELENSNYTNFKKQIDITQNLLPKTVNIDDNTSKVNELLGSFYFFMGVHHKSKKYYKKVSDYYAKSDSKDDSKAIISELKIAQIDDELSISYDKERINKKVLNLIGEYRTIFPNVTVLHNDLGNINAEVNIKLSDSLFIYTINLHKKFNIQYSPKIGIANNGLGINQLYLKNYKKADSLFAKAINQFDHVYGEYKNVNQIISYLNIVNSKLHQKEFLQATNFLNKMKETITSCFENKETIYSAYMLDLEGDIIKKEKPNNTSLYVEKYIQALKVAEKYYDHHHPYILNLQYKIKR